MAVEMRKEYVGIAGLKGPLAIVEGIKGIGYDEMVEMKLPDGSVRNGKVLESSDDAVLIQIFEGSSGINPRDVRVSFKGKPFEIGLSDKILGRVFNGMGNR